MRRKMMVGLVVAVAAMVPLASIAQPSKKANATQKTETPKGTQKQKAIARGGKLYATHCASCHDAGGNSVKPNKPIIGSEVTATLATFKSYLNEPIGDMPHYEHLIKDEKLLGDLYAYVKDMDKSAPATDGKQKSKEKKSGA